MGARKRSVAKQPKRECAKCGRSGRKGAVDPDGLWRCWWHAAATAHERKARADAQRAKRASVEAARASGKLPPEPEVEGRGQRPYAAAAALAASGQAPDAPAEAVAAGGAESEKSLLDGLSIAKPAHRLEALQRVIDRMADGRLTRTMGHGVIQALKAAEKEVKTGASDRGVVVKFVTISTRDEKERFQRGEFGATDATAIMDDADGV